MSALLLLLALSAQTGDGPAPARLAPATTYVPEEGATLPYRGAGAPIVECEIDGRGPYLLLVDTGASVTVLDERLATELELEVLGETALGDPSNPTAIRAKRVRVGELRLGDAALEGLEAVAWPQPAGLLPPGVRGIAGLPLFAGCTVTLDGPRAELRLETAPLGEPDGTTIVRATRDPRGGLLSVPVRVAGKEVLVHLDSGNQGGLVLPAELEAGLALVEGSRRTGKARLAGGEIEMVVARLDGALEVGPTRFERPEVRFGGGANLGHELMRRFAVSIDGRNERVRFLPPAAAAEGASGPR